MSELQKNCMCGEQISDEEMFAKLDEIINEYREKPGGLIPALQIAQSLIGYLPEKMIKHISNGFNKSYSEVAGIIGFYSFFSTNPRGKHIIRVCLGTACYVRGGKQLLDQLKDELKIDVGETTKDRMFTLEVARCFGACGLAPVITVDDEIHQRVKPTSLKEILRTYSANPEPEKENA